MKKDMKQVQLNEIQAVDVADIQKEIIEAFARRSYKYNLQENFEIFAVTISVVISNMCSSIGIKKIDIFLDDLSNNIKKIHKDVKAYSSYMYYEKGKKVSEGELN